MKSDRFYSGTGKKILRAPFPAIVLAYTEFCKLILKGNPTLAPMLPSIREFAEKKFMVLMKGVK